MSRGQPSGQTKESFTAGHPVPAVNETATVSKTPAESTASRSPAHSNGAWCHAKRSPACHRLRGDIGYCVYAVPGPLRADLVREPVSRGLGEFLCCASLELSWTAHGGLRNPARRKYGGWQRGAVAMGALPEPGMYRGTLATGRSTQINVRVRLSTGDKFVEIPVTP